MPTLLELGQQAGVSPSTSSQFWGSLTPDERTRLQSLAASPGTLGSRTLGDYLGAAGFAPERIQQWSTYFTPEQMGKLRVPLGGTPPAASTWTQATVNPDQGFGPGNQPNPRPPVATSMAGPTPVSSTPPGTEPLDRYLRYTNYGGNQTPLTAQEQAIFDREQIVNNPAGARPFPTPAGVWPSTSGGQPSSLPGAGNLAV